jgi:putative acetyltransferase
VVATSLLAHALDDARRRGVSRVSLETGSMEFFEPRAGSTRGEASLPCEPFGSYVEDPLSSFMTMELAPR